MASNLESIIDPLWTVDNGSLTLGLNVHEIDQLSHVLCAIAVQELTASCGSSCSSFCAIRPAAHCANGARRWRTRAGLRRSRCRCRSRATSSGWTSRAASSRCAPAPPPPAPHFTSLTRLSLLRHSSTSSVHCSLVPLWPVNAIHWWTHKLSL